MTSRERIAIFRIGHLGDTIIALPALWTVRKAFPDAEIYYLHQQADSKKVDSLEILKTGSVFDKKLLYKTDSTLQILLTILRLRLLKIRTIVYIPPFRTASQLKRDELFFRLSGVKRIVGMKGYLQTEYRPKGVPLPAVAHETDILLSHLALDGVSTDENPTQMMHLGLTAEERAEADRWLEAHGIGKNESIVGIGPGSKMPAKLWSSDRFQEVVSRLDSRFSPVFIAFGSPAEREICDLVLLKSHKKINAAGELTVRQSAAIFEKIKLYLGNDTGTMHIAASSGAKCVAIFSARDWPGRWFPYGEGHCVFREFVPCEGCMLEVCDKDNLCLDLITTNRVSQALAEKFRVLYPNTLG
jgi:heptosyltransferase-3